ncbi:MAG: TlpA disulfide reductase family protein [Bacteroidota bacterium]
MQKLILAILVFFTLSFGLRSQNTNIIGNVSGAEGLKIRLITTSDYISELTTKMDETTIDSLGNFKLKTSINESIFAQIQIDNYKGEIYLEPGRNYNIRILALNFKEDEKESPFLNRKRLEIEFKIKDSIELNEQIRKFNVLYNDFIIENFKALNSYHNRAKIDSFQQNSASLFSSSKNSFLNNYIKYKIAGMEQMGRTKSIPKLYSAFIKNQPILYNNVEYMYFFNQFYGNFFLSGRHQLSSENLSQFIKEKNYAGLLDSLGRDSLVKNEVVRELVFLMGLKEMFYSKVYNNENIISTLTAYSRKTKFKENKFIASNLILLFNSQQTGNKAPDFKLKTINNEPYSLSTFKGKYTYIGFFTTWCAGCMAENDAMFILKKKYGDKINFVSISADKQVLNLYYYLEKHKYDWIFLHYGNNIEILEKFGILTYPVFVLMDPNGIVINNPALKPSENIEDEFNSLLNKMNTKP